MASSSNRSERGFLPPQNDAERLLIRRITEHIFAVQHSGGLRTTSFLSDREQVLAQCALQKQQWQNFSFWGGYEDAERKMLCVYSEILSESAFNAVCLQIEPQRPQRPLSHRDYLGALLSLGIKRECVGDIVVNESGTATVLIINTVAPLVRDELSSVGRCAVRVTPVDVIEKAARKQQECTASISSLRLDALIAAMLHISRGQAVTLIKGGNVSVNHVDTVCVHEDIYENDIFSVRGRGKFELCKIGAQSKKGRTFISYLEY